MGVKSHLLSLTICILLLPCYIIFHLVIDPILQVAIPFFFQLITSSHFAWLPDSRFLDQCLVPFDQLMPICDAILGVSRYKKEHEEVRCVFCLSCVEEGEEVRELRCGHVFHRECLDGWIEFGRVTCPLCRAALVPFEVKAEAEEMDGDQ
ncbi:uncharacterized protein A4U43_C05F470 [Asparagus officinalis]|uniref:RING-type domain-containing protein n=1 Tax=Asparagus officinalis TaxID=4686 RepID=A0A5P1EN92_ASPOF|nr:uncharacterized protein A4U43_C05F470 [Asparagus officinalis]